MDILRIQSYLDKIAMNADMATGLAYKDGTVFVSTKQILIGKKLKIPKAQTNSGKTPLIMGGFSFLTVGEDSEVLCFIEDSKKECASILQVIAGSVDYFMSIDFEAKRESDFFKGIFLGEYIEERIIAEAYSLGIEFEGPRNVLLIESGKNDLPTVMDVLEELFRGSDDVKIVGVFDRTTGLVLNISEQSTAEHTGLQIVDTLETEFFIKTRVGIGQISAGLAELKKSFDSARIALEVSAVFDDHSKVVNFEKLGIARLINDISESASKSFIHEVLDDEVFEDFGKEYLATVNSFFENSLNISETSRKMFIHRNTLVYRLDKIKKLTGLDISVFEDAVVLKLAIMLRKYLGKATEARN